MVSRSDQPPDLQAAAAQRGAAERAALCDLAIEDDGPTLIRSALAFAALAHAGQHRDSDDAPFINHPSEVAQLLRDAGCSEVVVAAGLLHDTVEDTDVTVPELVELFGRDVARLVQAVSEDPSLVTYRQRKQQLREQVRNAGRDAALLFAADKISKVREFPNRVRRDQARLGTTARYSRARARLERSHQLHLEHYHESLRMLQDVAPQHALVKQLANELHNSPIAIHSGKTSART